MKRKRPHAARSSPFSDGSIPSENGGSVDQRRREPKRKGQHGGAAPTPVRVSRTGAAAHQQTPTPLCEAWAEAHREELAKTWSMHLRMGQANARPATLEADQQTRNILADCPERTVSDTTAAEYRRVYTRLASQGMTAWEKANSRAHWDKLRTACRFCMEIDIREWRRLADRARRDGDLEQAQRCTTEAWRLAIALDDQFLRIGHKGWAAKEQALRDQGRKPVNKSKRHTTPPDADMAVCTLLDQRHRGTRLLERHSERLALLALTGCRPAELMAGVKVSLWQSKKGTAGVVVEIKGAKVDAKRGQERRNLAFIVKGVAAQAFADLCRERGGHFTVETTAADYRSLNRALQAHGLSCYSFRHAVGSDLKQAIAAGAMTPEKAAQAMGHRSTESLTYYGTRRAGRRGRIVSARASITPRSRAVTRDQRVTARARAKAEANGTRPIAAPCAARSPLWQPTPLQKGLRPPEW